MAIGYKSLTSISAVEGIYSNGSPFWSILCKNVLICWYSKYVLSSQVRDYNYKDAVPDNSSMHAMIVMLP